MTHDVYVALSEGATVTRSAEVAPGVTVDYDETVTPPAVVGVEVLDALRVEVDGRPATGTGGDGVDWVDEVVGLATRIERLLGDLPLPWPVEVLKDCLLGEAAAALRVLTSEPREEHGQLYGGASVLVWPPDPTGELERVAPLEQRIEAGQRFGGKVLRRRVLVVEDWALVPSGVDRANELNGEVER